MKLRNLLILGALVVAVLGCGGGGGSSIGGPSGALFMTDSLDSNTHVWITVQKVVLTAEGGGSVTVFNDPAGKTIDLKTLRDPSGERYSFLATVRGGTYTKATFTVDKDLVLFTSGSSTGQARVFAGNNGSTADLVLNFPTAVQISPTSHVAVDFDLSNWTDDGTTVSGNPFLVVGSGVGLDDMDRHEECNLHGTVSALAGTAPDQTFTLTHDGRAVSVVTNSETVFCGFASLSDGDRVKVRGAFSTDLNAFVAASVRLDEEDDDDEQEVEGSVTTFVALAGTMDIEIDEAEGFTPMVDVVHVVTDGNTVFSDIHGNIVLSLAFFAALVVGDELEVEGTYDAQTNTLVATRVEFEDEEGGDGGGGGGR